MIDHHIFKVFWNTICLAYFPETVMNCDDDYVNKPEKYKCLGNTIDGMIFNKHDVILYIHSVHKNKHRRNSFQRQNYKMRLKQRSLYWINSMQVKKIFFTNVFSLIIMLVKYVSIDGISQAFLFFRFVTNGEHLYVFSR
jgi:hypothetical protein